MNELGETQFYMDDMIYGIPPIPNRMIMFNAHIKHRATSYRTQHRFTVAIKYRPFEWLWYKYKKVLFAIDVSHYNI